MVEFGITNSGGVLLFREFTVAKYMPHFERANAIECSAVYPHELIRQELFRNAILIQNFCLHPKL